MAEETIEKKVVLDITAPGAAATVADLKNNIKLLKDQVAEAKIGSEEYTEALNALKLNQNALRDANFATSSSFEKVVEGAAGAGNSYNALVHRMAALKEEYRSLDPTIEGQGQRMADVAAQINEVNDTLKAYDANIGNYQRNVGNYVGSIMTAFKNLPPFASKAKQAADNVGKSFQLLSTNPLLGVLTMLLPLITRITAALKENETAADAVGKVMKALQPVADFFAGIIEKIAGWISKAVDYIIELGQSSGIEFKNIVAGAVGVGNALLQFLLMPVRNIIDAFKGLGQTVGLVFKGQFKEAAQTAKQAGAEIWNNIKQGVDFKGNFEAGKQIGEQFAAGLKSTKRVAADAAGEVSAAVNKQLLKTWADLEKDIKRREALLAQWSAENAKMVEDDFAETVDSVQAMLDEMEAAQWAEIEAERAAAEEAERIRQQRIDTMHAYAGAVSSVLGAVADAYEASGDMSETEAKRMKGLRIAAAVIDTLSGAVSAYMGTLKSVPAPAGIPLAAINAASVLATGYAQIAKIQATDATGKGSATVSGGGMQAAAVNAPAPVQMVPVTRSLTSASEEDRLNRMADKQRVVLVYSDVQAAGQRTEVVDSETDL